MCPPKPDSDFLGNHFLGGAQRRPLILPNESMPLGEASLVEGPDKRRVEEINVFCFQKIP